MAVLWICLDKCVGRGYFATTYHAGEPKRWTDLVQKKETHGLASGRVEARAQKPGTKVMIRREGPWCGLLGLSCSAVECSRTPIGVGM